MIEAPPLLDEGGIRSTHIFDGDTPIIREPVQFNMEFDGFDVRYDANVNGVDWTYVPAGRYVQAADLPSCRREAYDFFKRKEVDTWTTSPGAAT
jgi:hypothetical protein